MPTSNLRILLIEDDNYKVRALSDFLVSELPGVYVSVARSLNTAIRAISGSKFDLALVDMSLPTYDLESDRHGGGTPQGFAGEDILRFIEAQCPSTWTVVVTQLSEFSDGSVTRTTEELASSLKAELGGNYLGLISYSGRHGGWRDSLKKLLEEAKLQ